MTMFAKNDEHFWSNTRIMVFDAALNFIISIHFGLNEI